MKNFTILILTFTFIECMTTLTSCNSSTRHNTAEDASINPAEETEVNDAEVELETIADSNLVVQPNIDLKASESLIKLESGEDLSAFLNENWTFIYHRDNRCDGSTDGRLENLKDIQIDSNIKVPVKNDGDGWTCDKRDPTSYDLNFDLGEQIANWDRFEISHDENQEKNIVHIVGAGMSDYLKLHYNERNRIVKLEYGSEDPG